ncbi:MAG: hypothetical protein WCG80_14845 [Spirochaetales bacterium]
MEMPQQGFLKTTRPNLPPLPSEIKVQLIRKGNDLFSRGEFEQAKKIFVSTLYTDGMVRLGDYYQKQKDYLSAFQMYKLAPAPPQAEAMVVKLTTVLRNWIEE